MRFLKYLPLLSLFNWGAAATNNGKITVVQWDKYSLTVQGSRVYILSGEFHYPRLPVPEMWLDVFQKLKANGYNAVSLYFFWGYHQTKQNGAFDFTNGAHNMQRILDMAKQAGLYVLARAGPYVNGEFTGGGFALWTSTGAGGSPRTDDATYHAAWLPWITGIGQILAKNQITNGGNVILHQHENEFTESSHTATSSGVKYMEQITAAFDAAGVVVPSFHNEKGMRGQSWSTDYQNVGGAVDIYGLDSYPGGFTCSNINSGFNVLRTYYQWFQSYAWTQPSFMPEFQGGYFTPWGGSFYDDCPAFYQPAQPDVYYKNNIAQKIMLMSIYMAFGGTNWGHTAAPVVYSSYDYGAPIRETREIRDKVKQGKLVGLFTRVAADLLQVDMTGNGTAYTDNTGIYTWLLTNPTTKARFYITQQVTTSSTTSITFTLKGTTSAGSISIPNINLAGRQSKIICTDFKISSSTTLLYTSGEILTYANLDVDVIVLYLNEGQVGQFAFKGSPGLTFTVYGSTKPVASGSAYVYTQGAGVTAVKFSNGVLMYLLDKPSAYNFYAPPTTTNPNVKPNQHIFVMGPHLVRSASVSGGTVNIVGDNAVTTSVEVYAGSGINTLVWNGQTLSTTKTAYGSLKGSAAGAESVTISLPSLNSWKVGNALPEMSPTYDDSKWTVCNKQTTLSPVKPITLPVLYSSDYGYHAGIKVYRGRFDGKTATSANITVQGGIASGWNAWLNGKLVGTVVGDATNSINSLVVSFSGVTLQTTNNVLTVLCDYTGHDQANGGGQGTRNPRGILGATLNTGTFKEWRLAGNAGADNNIDPVRGSLNEGGLYGERLGWHLPGFDDSSWGSGSPTTGLSSSGVAWYSTTFNLNIPSGIDAPIGLRLSSPSGTKARVQIFLNGYQYGKYIPHIGPQTTFPFPPGIINNNGANRLSISLWAQTDAGAKLSSVELINYGKYKSGYSFSQDWSYLQPGWTSARNNYK